MIKEYFFIALLLIVVTAFILLMFVVSTAIILKCLNAFMHGTNPAAELLPKKKVTDTERAQKQLDFEKNIAKLLENG